MAPIFLQIVRLLHTISEVTLKFMECNFGQKPFESKFNSCPLVLVIANRIVHQIAR